MTNPTPHGQVPEALIDLIDAYAETRHRCGGIYNAKTEAARNAVIEALSGVQALSAAPAIGDELRDTLVAVSAAIAERDDRAAQKMICEILAASPTPPAEQQAQPGAVYAELPQPDSWFHFTAQFWENKLRDFADRTHALRMQAAPKAAPTRTALPEGWTDCTIEFGNDGPEVVAYGPKRMMTRLAKWLGKYFAQVIAEAAPKAAPGAQNTVPAEWLEQAYREGWAACRDAETIGEEAEDWAFGNSTANSRMIDAQQAAPKQEVQEPHGWLYEWTHSSATGKPDSTYTAFTTDEAHARKHDNCRAIYTAPQPAPAELERLRERIARMGLDVDRAMRGHVNEQSPLGTQRLAAIAALVKPKPAPPSDDVVKDAARYRFLAGHCRSTSEHWSGRWSIVVDGPAPKSHDSEDDFDEAVDAAIAAQRGNK